MLRSGFLRALSILILALSMAQLFMLQWRALNRFESATREVLSQASAHAAERVAQRIRRDFKAPAFNVLERIDHTDVRELRLTSMATALRDPSFRSAGFIDRFFVWSRPPGGSDSVSFYSMRLAGNGEETDDPSRQGFFHDPPLSRLVVRHALEFSRIRANFALARVAHDGRSYDIVLHLLYDLPERITFRSFLGFTIDSRQLQEHYFASAVNDEIAGQGSLAGFPNLVASIFDHEGTEIYRSGRSLAAAFEDEVVFPYIFYDFDIIDSLSPFQPEVRYWKVRTGYATGDIAGIAHWQTNQQRLIWVVVACVAVVGILLIARASAREARLAQLKSDFIASVSHELKTPLAKIQLFADTLRAGRARSAEKSHEYAEIISNQARMLNRLIAGVLDFGKFETGVREYPKQELDLRAVLRNAAASFEYDLQQHGFSHHLELPQDEVPVRGNAEGLQQVFENLIGNAIKYSEQTRELRVNMERANGHVHVHVSDRGIGIPRRELRRIFDKFYRVPQTAARITGSGLGLTIVRHVVAAHGGRVSVESSPGVGSTFTVSLPLESGEIPSEAQVEPYPGR